VAVLKTSSRVLRLLSLLQARREWSGGELGERLEVDVRTVRRDVDRLRDLGYVIEASAGVGGGYRLGAGTTTPPLLLDEDEAIAVAAALSVAAGSVANLQEVALRALVKLEQLLPVRLRRRLSALQAVTVSMGAAAVVVDPRVLTSLAILCRDQLVATFEYRDLHERVTQREVEPMRLVHTGRVWYLAAWDRGRSDWRTFRVDRIRAEPQALGRFTPRPPPEDLATYVARSISALPYRCVAQLGLAQAPAELSLPHWLGVLSPGPDGGSILTVGGDSWEVVAALAMHLGGDFVLLGPPEAHAPMRAIAERLRAAAGASKDQESERNEENAVRPTH
jgi:predicted DNA-binding transcriptional regulator YafY